VSGARWVEWIEGRAARGCLCGVQCLPWSQHAAPEIVVAVGRQLDRGCETSGWAGSEARGKGGGKMAPTRVRFTWNGVSRDVFVGDRMDETDLRRTVCASLGLPEDALKGVFVADTGRTYGLDRVCKEPQTFAPLKLHLVLDDEEDDDDDDDEEEEEEEDEGEDYDDIDEEIDNDEDNGFLHSPELRPGIGGAHDVTNMLRLDTYDVGRIMQMFAEEAPGGYLDQETFVKVFSAFLKDDYRGDPVATGQLLGRLFAVFDVAGDNRVSLKEFLAGLTTLCSGSRDDRIKIAFSMFDIAKDGRIWFNEMTQYLTSVFKVIASTSSSVFEQFDITPEELAEVTAEQCFEEAGTPLGGALSWEQFHAWYSAGSNDDENIPMPQQALSLIEGPSIKKMPLSELSGVLHLDECSAEEVFSAFADRAHDGNLDRHRFKDAYVQLMRSKRFYNITMGNDLSSRLLDRLFDVFDEDGNGLVDFEELCGVSVLCAGDRNDKIRAAFSVFDYNNDGFISFEEMRTYMASVYKMLELSPDGKRLPTDPEDLAIITARACFEEADEDRDGRLTFEEFKRWWEKPSSFGGVVSAAAGVDDGATDAARPVMQRRGSFASRGMGLQKIRELTGVNSLHIFEVFDEFGRRRDVDGDLTYEGYVEAFDSIRRKALGPGKLRTETPQERALYEAVVQRLWSLFDEDGNGVLSFEEIAGGLSVLCQNPSSGHSEKVRAVFSLFDKDGNGYVDPHELAEMLSSIFTVQFDLKGIEELNGYTPDALAQETTIEAFTMFDKNADAKLSFEEFEQWYLSTEGGSVAAAIQDEGETAHGLENARHLTGLNSVSISEALDLFSEVVRPGTSGVTRGGVYKVFKRSGIVPDGVDKKMLRALIDNMFDLFVDASSSLADFKEFMSGISILCSSADPEERASISFELFDLNNDGFISRHELSQYLTSVYKVMFMLEPSVRAHANGMSPRQLAHVTTLSIFERADVDKNGKLDWEEFRAWFTNQPYRKEKEDNWMTLDEVRRLTRLDRLTPDEAFQSLAQFTDANGCLSKDAFFRAFHQLAQHDDDESCDRLRLVLHRLFDTLDLNKDNVVDLQELGAGVSILCGGPGGAGGSDASEARLRAVFDLYDIDGDGFIQESELIRYLTCVFRVMYATQPRTKQDAGGGLEADDLARQTAKEIMRECDKNRDGKLSLEEFRLWYQQGAGKQLSVAAEMMAADSDWFNLNEIRRLTNIHQYSAGDLLEAFGDAAVEAIDGTMFITRESFDEVFQLLLDEDACETEDDFVRLTFILDRLYDMFDYNRDGRVSYSELSTGLMVLAGDQNTDRMRQSFILFDEDGDGYVSLPEMVKLMTSTFKVLFEVQPHLRERVENVSAEELARQTAEQAFIDADLNDDGRLSFEEFSRWVSASNSGKAVQTLVTSAPAFVSMEETRRLTKIDRYDAEDIRDQFDAFANEKGELDRQGFMAAFNEIVAEASEGSDPLSPALANRLAVVLDRLFDVFDLDKNGFIDARELNAGLSILNPSMDQDTKARLAFELWDADGSGRGIKFEHVVQYLTSVFALLYETQRGLREQIGTTPQMLARATAMDIFETNGLNLDEELGYETFQRWYSEGGGANLTSMTEAVPLSLTLPQIRRLTRFDQFLPHEIFEAFAEKTPEGTLDRHTFEQAFREIALRKPPAMTSRDMDRLHLVINRIFNAFDTNNSGRIEYTDLAAGLSVLAGGGKNMRAESCFALYDLNGDGIISRSELHSFLTSVFKIIFALQPESQQRLGGVAAETIAEASALQIFAEMDTKQDDRISWPEFKRWWDADAIAMAKRKEESKQPTLSLADARRLTGLSKMDATEAFEEFAREVDRNGDLTRSSFERVFRRIFERNVKYASEAERQHAAEIVSQLFDLFDQDNDGTVDYLELASGVSVLCRNSSPGTKGNGAASAEAAFKLYDENETGFISRESMEAYLAAVFRLMLETQEGTAAAMDGASPELLTKEITDEIFAEADLNHDDQLSFDEFRRWWNSMSVSSSAVNQIVSQASSWLSMEELKRITGFGNWSQQDIFEEFALEVDKDGLLHPADFHRVCRKFTDESTLSERDRQMLPLVYDRLFKIMDADGSGDVDFAELSAGIALLSRDSAHEKAQAAFSLFDEDDDGLLDVGEIARYLHSVYRLYMSTSASAQQLAGGVTPEHLAESTARQVILDYDVDGDGRLNFEEFRRWMDSEEPNGIARRGKHSDDGREVLRATPVNDDAQSPDWLSLEEVKRITGFGSRNAQELLEAFVSHVNGEGVLTRDAFETVFDELTQSLKLKTEEKQHLMLIRHRLYDIMDVDSNGVVDFSEMAAGLLLFTDGGAGLDMDEVRDSKVDSLFALYDIDGSGYITREGLQKILSSMFKVIYEVDPQSAKRSGNAPPEDLAHACVESIFEQADTNHDDRLSRMEFAGWFESGSLLAASMDRVAENAVKSISIEDARRVTGLGQLSTEAVFEMFALAGEEGLLDRKAFGSVFDEITERTFPAQTEQDKALCQIVVEKLFRAFSDGGNTADFALVSAGLSILTRDPREVKIEQSFNLFDLDQNGYISRDEMETYLHGIFAALASLNPEKFPEGVSPLQLAQATTETAMEEADLDGDDRISLEEFTLWFGAGGGGFLNPQNITQKSGEEEKINGATMRLNGLAKVKRLTKLENLSLDEVLDTIRSVAGEKDLDFEEFISVFDVLIEHAGGHESYTDQKAAAEVTRTLFGLFDRDNSGTVDQRELAAGLSVLCSGAPEDRVMAAFRLYDANHDEKVSVAEMQSYLTSVFRVLFAADPEAAQRMGVEAEHLAKITTEQCFLECDSDGDGLLTYEEFAQWYKSNAER